MDENKRRTAAGRSGSTGRSGGARTAAPDARSRARSAARRRRRVRQRRIMLGIAALILVVVAVIIGRTVIGNKKQKEIEALQTEGIAYLEQGNFDAAIANFDQILEKSKGNIGKREKTVLQYKAEAEYKKGDYAAALAISETLIEADSNNDEYQKLRSHCQIELGDYEAALTYEPLAPFVYNRMAVTALNEGRYDDAIIFTEKGLEYGESDMTKSLKCNQANAYMKKTDFDKALELFESWSAAYGADENVDKAIQFLKTR